MKTLPASRQNPVVMESPEIPMETQDEKHIIEAVLQGDAAAYRILVERYQKPVYSLMLRLTGSTMTAEDLTQEAFTRAYEKLHTFRRGRRFFPWLYSIAVNRCRDHMRRKGIRKDLFSDIPEGFTVPDPDAGDCARQADCVSDVNRISEAMDRLPLKYSEPLLLYYREELTVKEIAAALNLSVSAAKVRIHRGRDLLKRLMGVDHETP